MTHRDGGRRAGGRAIDPHGRRQGAGAARRTAARRSCRGAVRAAGRRALPQRQRRRGALRRIGLRDCRRRGAERRRRAARRRRRGVALRAIAGRVAGSRPRRATRRSCRSISSRGSPRRSAESGAPLAVAASARGLEPMFALWSTALAREVEAALAAGDGGPRATDGAARRGASLVRRRRRLRQSQHAGRFRRRARRGWAERDQRTSRVTPECAARISPCVTSPPATSRRRSPPDRCVAGPGSASARCSFTASDGSGGSPHSSSPSARRFGRQAERGADGEAEPRRRRRPDAGEAGADESEPPGDPGEIEGVDRDAAEQARRLHRRHRQRLAARRAPDVVAPGRADPAHRRLGDPLAMRRRDVAVPGEREVELARDRPRRSARRCVRPAPRP